MNRKRPQLVFFVGSGRCGTTLLRNLVDLHQDVGVTPELKYYDRIIPLGEKRKSPKSLLQEWNNSADPLFRTCLESRQELERRLSGMIDDEDCFVELVRLTSTKPDAPIQVEKTPSNVYFLESILKRHPDAKVIHIVRDGRDYCASAFQRGWSSDVTMLSVLWNESLRSFEGAVEHGVLLSGAWKDVRYEDVLNDPYGITSDVLSFMGGANMRLKKDDFEAGLRCIKSFSSFFAHEARGVYRSSHSRSVFDQDTLDMIESLIWRHLDKYGYQVKSRKASTKSRLRYHMNLMKHRIRIALARHETLRIYDALGARIRKAS